MDYKVCILAAGKGTRLSYAENYNKALIPVGEKATLTRIIEKFPEATEIVIAVGYNARFIEDFFKIAYPELKITLVPVNPYEGEGSGPGYSLYSCRRYLQCPFIFTSADTLVLESVPPPDHNWLGVAHTDDPENYCMADVYNGLVKKFYIKVPMAELLRHCEDPKAMLNSAFIGMAGVADYQDFWRGFEKNREVVQGEIQVMDGLRRLTLKQLVAQPFTWFDTGNDLQYYFTNQYFSKLNLLTKKGEFIYFENGKTIKYFSDEKIVANRIRRADLLKGIVPILSDRGQYFYAYRFIEGKTLNKIDEVSTFRKFLAFCEKKLWQPIPLEKVGHEKFSQAVHDFYFTKTNKRLEAFYKGTDIKDGPEAINGVKVPPLKDLLARVDWKHLCEGKPVLFHGDLQPENILVHPDESSFTLIDWRQDFGGLVEYGDIYYDFAKLYHAMIISNEIIRNNEYKIVQEQDGVHFDYLMKSNLLEFKEEFEKFLKINGYDLQKVKILTAIVFLNIAPLSHYPYNVFVYYLGKDMLHKALTP